MKDCNAIMYQVTRNFKWSTYLLLCIFIVDAPIVTVTTTSPQTVGDTLTLTCSVNAVQGVITMANIIWTSSLTELQRIDGERLGDMLVYTNNYTIPILNTSDDGRIYHCKVVVISTTPSIMATDSITLDVIGECDYSKYFLIIPL